MIITIIILITNNDENVTTTHSAISNTFFRSDCYATKLSTLYSKVYGTYWLRDIVEDITKDVEKAGWKNF